MLRVQVRWLTLQVSLISLVLGHFILNFMMLDPGDHNTVLFLDLAQCVIKVWVRFVMGLKRDRVCLVHLARHVLQFSSTGSVLIHEYCVTSDALHLLNVGSSAFFLTLNCSKINCILGQLLLVVVINGSGEFFQLWP